MLIISVTLTEFPRSQQIFLCGFVVYTTGASCFKVFLCSLSSCVIISYSIVTTLLGEEGAGLCASRVFVCFVCVSFCHYSLPWCRGAAGLAVVCDFDSLDFLLTFFKMTNVSQIVSIFAIISEMVSKMN